MEEIVEKLKYLEYPFAGNFGTRLSYEGTSQLLESAQVRFPSGL